MSKQCWRCGRIYDTAGIKCPEDSCGGVLYTVSKEVQCQLCQRGEPCAENLKLTLKAENALLKKKLEMALRGLDEYADGQRWSSRTGKVSQGLVYDVFFPDCGGDHGYELARRIKAEIEEVK